MYRRFQLLALGALFITPPSHARDCSAPPVRDSEQAMCFAMVYADKNRLSYGPSFKKTVGKSRTAWTIRFADTRRDTKGAGWEVDVDVASGTVVRFTGYKGSER
jgi:hypothetical protein